MHVLLRRRKLNPSFKTTRTATPCFPSSECALWLCDGARTEMCCILCVGMGLYNTFL